MMLSGSQSVHGFKQFIRDCSEQPPNWIDDLFLSLKWFSHSKCISMCETKVWLILILMITK